MTDQAAFEPISKQEVRTMLLAEHGVAVGEDDPILMSVTLHAAFMGDLARSLEAHRKAQNESFQQAVVGVVESVTQSANKLRDALLDGAVRSVLNGVAQQSEALGTLQSKTKSQLIAQAVLTGLNWAAVITFFFILK
ncbi:MAG: hypothetical protein KG075_16450 [Alphaproteobacteria bacterium]|nr:hypothetical protein [Alphaproteobacteria bacterium]